MHAHFCVFMFHQVAAGIGTGFNGCDWLAQMQQNSHGLYRVLNE